MKVLVCGGRDYNDWESVRIVLDALHCAPKNFIEVVMHGDARGADRLGQRWAHENGVTELAFPANWKRYKNAAGTLRNTDMANYMADEPEAWVCVAFPGGNGTADMVRKAAAVKVNVMRVGKT